MNGDMQVKRVQIIGPISLAANATGSCATVDTYGFEMMRVVLDIGVNAAVNIATLNMIQSDKSNMSGNTAYANFGTDTNDLGNASTVPGNTSNTCYAIEVDLRGKDRYHSLTIVNGANGACLVSAWADLSRPHEAPRTASLAGYAERIIQ